MSTTPVPGCILVVDDDPDVLTAARLALSPRFQKIQTLRGTGELAATLARLSPDAVLLDMNFTAGAQTGREGLDWLGRIRALDPHTSVVLMTAYGGVALAVESLKSGAVDFVLKPWENERLIATLSSAVSLARARREATDLSVRNGALAAETAGHASELLGGSPALKRVLELMRRAAPTDANVLILGESGTGKELTAREIHRLSRRAQGPFISVDLGALPDSLFESELFGHRKGAFTGADSDRVGRIQAADGGTLFLDEIGNLPPHSQRKLLTVLERREIIPVGANRPVPVDIRLISATNRPASQLTSDSVMRQDLLFRIKTVELVLPPLRERRDDIALLIDHYLAVYARKYGNGQRLLTQEALALLTGYAWPGNVRELRHAIERATILAEAEQLTPADFPFAAPGHGTSPAQREAEQAQEAKEVDLDLERIERRTIQQALAVHGGNISQAAAALGLTRPALYRRMLKHGI
jgi:DNA-binding NtrC family response regulator